MSEQNPCPTCVITEAFAVIAAARAALATVPAHPALPHADDLLHVAQDALALLIEEEN